MKRSLESSNVEEAPSGKEKARSGECAVCFETQEMDTRRISQDCRHDRDICEQCTRRHLERNMTIGGPDELVCPSLGCTAVVELDQVSDDDFRWCSNPECGNGFCCIDSANTSFVTCEVCGTKTCVTHRSKWHQGITCSEYDAENESKHSAIDEAIAKEKTSVKWWMNEKKRLENSSAGSASDAKFILEMKRVEEKLDEKKKREEELLNQKMKAEEEAKTLSSLEEMGCRRCPQCGQGIEKVGGCDHFTCTQCKHEFCWLCLAAYKGDQGIKVRGNAAHRPTCNHFRK